MRRKGAGLGRTVAVIVPAFNAESVIGRCLAAIAAQTRPPDVVVVVDDASTDGTVDAACVWKPMLPLSLVCRPTNAGPGEARADGIAALETDLIALCDADDVWLPDHLDVLTRLHAEHGGIVAAQYLDWTSEKVAIEHPLRVPRRSKQLKEMVFRNYIISATLFDRELYESAGGFRPLRQSEDWDLWIRMLAIGARITAATHPTLLRPPSQAGRSVETILRNHIEILDEFASSRSDPALRRLVARAVKNHEARIALAGSFADAEEGRFAGARRRARGGFPGRAREKIRSAVMMTSPRKGLAIKRRRIIKRGRPGQIVDLRDKTPDERDRNRSRDHTDFK